MRKISERWRIRLAQRTAAGTFRQQRQTEDGVDFYSNDYLGLAKSTAFQEKLLQVARQTPSVLTGTSASRVLYGHDQAVATVEKFIAAHHGVARSLLLDSGYHANLALLSAIAQRGDTILIDELVHRSVHDACRLSFAITWKFRHQDLDHLERLLSKASGNTIVAIESLYSMDGDFAAIPKIWALCQRYGAELVVDEAHAVGLFPRGLVHEYGLEEKVLATIVTYGKAFGLNGAAILGSTLLCDYLVNYSSPLLYTTGISPFKALSIHEAYLYMEEHPELRERLRDNIAYYVSLLPMDCAVPQSPIQPVYFPKMHRLQAAVDGMQRCGLTVYPIFSPTVAKGKERLRICIHAFNTRKEIEKLCQEINTWKY
ncbi:aminotransferase class I/II-fold pyridoxal phosphate-dependent enzyme [Sphingobacterium paludis]|uniref:8-amino-7-oxononanoate synthase n=1 Tax=Sphingobacterium paludis TaxID=1476465 RepID=A0A4R7D7P2_9SPHI|nr:pyridoxal phosphate-dependent aminotransferase family protein [Sphingobacterium paludis]TDS17213.1 8-amino-7-oxononanoate synthase [Sphingobacterium paludis]